MKILDCTLRDGGYYNYWDFDSAVVTSYLQAMAESGIDYIELGLRNFAKSGFLGAFAYCTEDFLNRLELPEGPIYGVMVDAKTILNSDLSVQEAVDALFVPSEQSKIDLVRIAAHFHEVEHSEPMVKALKDKGYTVAYNLMQAGGKPDDLLAEKTLLIASWGCLDTLYFADSLGNMNAQEVQRIVNILRQHWHGTLGIHAHNNMAKALDNALIARQAGVDWLDATVTGMGRGAGNAQTENLLAVISQESDRYAPSPVYELAIRHFEPMQHDYGWGSSLLYFLGAQNDVHPTYIQNLLSDTHYGTDEIVGAIEYLSKLENTSSYNGSVFKAALSFSASNKALSGSTSLQGIAEGREIVILANGPSLIRYEADILAYIRNVTPLVIAINALSIDSDYVDYYCISRNTKFLSEYEVYAHLNQPIILPKHRFTEDELLLFGKNVELYDFGLEVQSSEFTVGDSTCVIPYDVTVAYALAIAENMKAKSISLIGFDGYESYDKRQLEMIKILTLAMKSEKMPPLQSLTPSNYPLVQGSIYAPV